MFGCGGGADASVNNFGNAGSDITTFSGNGYRIVGGAVTAYAISNGFKSSLIQSATTDTQGNYTITVTSPPGWTLLKVSDGMLQDDSSSTQRLLTTPLWSVSNSQSKITTAITPLTDAVVTAAAQLPGGMISSNLILALSSAKSKFGFDPTLTIPCGKNGICSDDSKLYTAFIGGIYQYQISYPKRAQIDVVNDIAESLNGGKFLGDPKFKGAISNYLMGAKNISGIADLAELDDLIVKHGGSPVLLNTSAAVAVPSIISVIHVENAKTELDGATTSWQITNNAAVLNSEIEGYASEVSINRGGAIDLYVNTIDPSYTINIYRMGWYGGKGGRLVAGPISLSGVTQPVCPIAAIINMVECDWSKSYSLTVPKNTGDPTDWASGFYLVKLTGSSGKEKYIPFVVRDDERKSDFLFQFSETTYQAYNSWGGKSLYASNSINGIPSSKVSFNRPYKGTTGADQFLMYEVEMVRFIEKEGYDVSYSTDLDTHLDGSKLLNHRAFLSVGHDEYWTKNMRDNVEAARDAGVNLGFFSANQGYWQIRFESSANSTHQQNRVIAGYRQVSSGLDPMYLIHPELSSVMFRSANINRPEAALVGVMFDATPINSNIVISDCSNFITVGTGLSVGSVLPNMLGYEVDILDPSSPSGIFILSRSPYKRCLDTACNQWETRYSSATFYQAASGAGVFATGSMQWNWGLSFMGPNFRYSNSAVQQMTRNVLNNFIDL